MKFPSTPSLLALSLLVLPLLAPAFACGGTSDPAQPGPDAGAPQPASGEGDAGAPPASGSTPGVDVTVMGFDHRPVDFTPTENHRVVDVAATFPEAGAYEKIVLHLALDCPSGRCDAWDRFGTLGVVIPAPIAADEKVIEIARYMTPYGVKGAWNIDVTDLRPLLRGALKLRAFIDTWVGPGHASGNGWLITTSFEMVGGAPAKEPIAVIPIWTHREVPYGDPAKPVSASLAPQAIDLPAGATSFAVRSFVTGHGQGNADNCAEFCPREHAVTVGEARFAQRVWRADCATTTVPNQAGNVRSPRAGWCPGADVRAWTVDVTSGVSGKPSVTFGYDVQAYENTCRPDAPTCAGCTLGTSCEFDGNRHTSPYYSVSSALIAYREAAIE